MKVKLSYLFLLAGWFTTLSGCSQGSQPYVPIVDTIRHELGDSTLMIIHWRYPVIHPIQLVLLHHNEQTANAEAGRFSTGDGIEYIRLQNNGQRLVSFAINDTIYRFDPNRMFSAEGAWASLKKEGPSSDTALKVVLHFAETFLQLLDTTKTIIALHNNTPGSFSLLNYANDGSSLVHQNADQDPDDFFLTNDRVLFERLRSKNVNAVLENAEQVADDGSMSILFGKRKWRYVNVEAEHGHGPQQQRMLHVLKASLTD